VADAELVASQTEGGGAVSRAVVGHDALNADAAAAIVLDGGPKEAAGGVAKLVRSDIGQGDARGVVDRDVNKVPADAAIAQPVATVTVDAVSDAADSAEFFDIQVDELTRLGSLVAVCRRTRLKLAPA